MTDRLARLREMQREYEAQVDPPAWLSALGQLDVAAAIEIEEQRMREENGMFRFDPDEYVNVTLFGLNFEGRVQRCIWNGRRNLYDVEYCRDGNIERREFAEDELKQVKR